MDSKTAYAEKLSAEMVAWDIQIERLKEKAESATAEKKFEYSKAVAALQLKRDEAAEKLQRISTASDHEWEDLKSGTEQIRSEISNLLIDIIRKT